jgi:hypothetical protein
MATAIGTESRSAASSRHLAPSGANDLEQHQSRAHDDRCVRQFHRNLEGGRPVSGHTGDEDHRVIEEDGKEQGNDDMDQQGDRPAQRFGQLHHQNSQGEVRSRLESIGRAQHG